MKLIFDHILGKQEDQDLVLCRPLAEVPHDEENDALETGWLALDSPINGQELFYQSRSTRINLEGWEPRFKHWKIEEDDLRLKEIEANEMVKLLGLPKIYKEYMKRKGFKQDYDPFTHMSRRDAFLIFYTKSMTNIVGFTKIKKYMYQEDSISTFTSMDDDDQDFDDIMWAGYESVLHCNSIPISQLTLDMEIKWAQDHDAQYYYMGSGYERSSLYKSKWDGFEWWTGTSWSTSKKLYQKLCRSDSRVATLQDVAKIQSLHSRI